MKSLSVSGDSPPKAENKWRSVVFYEPGKEPHGYYFYEAASDSKSGKIYGVKGLTLAKALVILKSDGVDAINNFKMNIAVYYPL